MVYFFCCSVNTWRHSSVGQSIRFIPEVSPVRIQVPLPIKAQRNAAPFLRPVGQVVKTPPFHGGNMGSSPVRVTKTTGSAIGGACRFVYLSARDSKGAGVNELPGAAQSRAPACPQARSPVRVTKANKSEPYLPGWRWVRILLFLRAISSSPSRKPGKAIE